MTDALLDPLRQVARTRQAPDPAPLVSEHEEVHDRVVVVHHAAPGLDPFLAWHFEVSEQEERLDLSTAVRTYEELVIVKTETTAVETIHAVLRREQAEITTEDPRQP